MKYIIASFIMFVVLYFIRGYFYSSIINTFLLICLGAITYVISLFIVKDEFFFSILRNALKKNSKIVMVENFLVLISYKKIR